MTFESAFVVDSDAFQPSRDRVRKPHSMRRVYSRCPSQVLQTFAPAAARLPGLSKSKMWEPEGSGRTLGQVRQLTSWPGMRDRP
jgi:hypothetical protein